MVAAGAGRDTGRTRISPSGCVTKPQPRPTNSSSGPRQTIIAPWLVVVHRGKRVPVRGGEATTLGLKPTSPGIRGRATSPPYYIFTRQLGTRPWRKSGYQGEVGARLTGSHPGRAVDLPIDRPPSSPLFEPLGRVERPIFSNSENCKNTDTARGTPTLPTHGCVFSTIFIRLFSKILNFLITSEPPFVGAPNSYHASRLVFY